MEIAQALIQQICIMFLLMAVGAVIFRVGLISQQTTRDLGAVLLNLVLPAVIIKSFWGNYSAERLVALGITFVLSLALLVLAMVIARIFFPRDGVAEFSAAYSNCGFIGIPLVTGALGEDAVFFIACLIAELNILQATYGKWRITGSTASITPKAVFSSPLLISLLIGVLLFVLQVPLPSIASSVVSTVANLNTPFAMIILGVYLAQCNPRELFTTSKLYLVSFVRLIVVPLASIVLLALVPCDATIKYAVLISAAAPVGSNVSVYCQQVGHDTSEATGEVCLSTILSIVSMPIVVSLASLVL